MRLLKPVRDIRTIKTLLTRAEAQAHEAGDAMPGAEHLLLSALALPDGTARRALERVGADPDGLRPAIAAQHAQALLAIGIEPPDDDVLGLPAGSGGAAARGVFRATASAQAAFRAAVDLAKADKGSPLLGAHVVAAVARMEHGTSTRALRAMGIDRHALAIAAQQELEARRTASAR
jgi:ATP-dependent Clp protease ATP-binding subunit ClpA